MVQPAAAGATRRDSLISHQHNRHAISMLTNVQTSVAWPAQIMCFPLCVSLSNASLSAPLSHALLSHATLSLCASLLCASLSCASLSAPLSHALLSLLLFRLPAASQSSPRRRLLQKGKEPDADMDSLDRTLAALKGKIAAAKVGD